MDLHPERMTWAVLLARWVQFAKASLALPNEGEGRQLRDSVPDLIQLQAVYFALQDLNDLQPEQRALALDRAGLLIERHAAALRSRWADGLPAQIAELIDDAQRQLDAAAKKQG